MCYLQGNHLGRLVVKTKGLTLADLPPMVAAVIIQEDSERRLPKNRNETIDSLHCFSRSTNVRCRNVNQRLFEQGCPSAL